MPLKIALVAGEASGDLLGAGLIRALQSRHPDVQCFGIAGPQMQMQGCDAWHPAETLSLFGLFEVLGHLRRLLRLRKQLVNRLLADPPDLFIGIDAPDFNLGLERQLKAAGIPTVHYVSPSVWAWRQGRVRKIARSVDLMLTLFPFEPDFYREHGVAACFVGHPMADEIQALPDAAMARSALGLDPAKTTIALLPGSRGGEVKRLAEPFIQAAVELNNRYPELQFATALTSDTTRAIFRQTLSRHPDLVVATGADNARDLLAACDVALLASGTISLEAMLVNRPMVVAYRLSPATYGLAKLLRLVKSEHIALPNILAGARLVPELVQAEASPQALADAVSDWLNNPARQDALQQQFLALHEQLRCNASNRAAEAVLGLLE